MLKPVSGTAGPCPEAVRQVYSFTRRNAKHTLLHFLS
jgi:hypothetical protein